MYSSENFVLFVNYDDFFTSISKKIDEYKGKNLTFFSGYDCDSLAFDKLSGFADQALSFFSSVPDTELELRTKSIAINSLLQRRPLSNCVVAFSLSPAEIAKSLDSKAPSIGRRINAIKQLAAAGWKIGLRFDPLIYTSDWQKLYSSLFSEIMEGLDPSMIHSISYGPLRFPKKMYKKAAHLHPEHKLFAFPMEEANGVISYGTKIETQMHDFLKSELNNYISENKIFQCIT
jgi:spore photoproduct lyase